MLNSASTNPFGSYLGEILRTEGFNGYQTDQIANLTSTELASFPVVLLAQTTLAPREVGEFDSRRRRHDHVAGVRVLQRGPRARSAVRIVEQRTGAVDDDVLALAARDDLVPLAEQNRLGCGLAVEELRQPARIELAFRQAVDHPGAVRGGHERARDVRVSRLEPRRCLHSCLAVVRAHDDGVPLEELVRPARGIE